LPDQSLALAESRQSIARGRGDFPDFPVHVDANQIRFIAQIPLSMTVPNKVGGPPPSHTKEDNLWGTPVNSVLVATIEFYSLILIKAPTSQPPRSRGDEHGPSKSL